MTNALKSIKDALSKVEKETHASTQEKEYLKVGELIRLNSFAEKWFGDMKFYEKYL
jgi:hypothetical protein